MEAIDKKEVWLRGPLPLIAPALQPVAHALLQAREEVNELMRDFPPSLLWQRPGGTASAGFHLLHMSGVLDRLFSYANAQALSVEQLQFLAAEEKPDENVSVSDLVEQFNSRVDRSLEKIRNVAPETLFEIRGVGRAQIPSTVFGLMVHAAEHTMRHLGQLLVTVKVLKNQRQNN